MPGSHVVTLASQKWADLVNEWGKGRIKVEFYPSAQLYASHDLSTAIPSGAVNMSECTPASLGGTVPSTGFLDLSFMFSSVEELAATLEGGGSDIIDAEMAEKNMKLVFFIDGGTLTGPSTSEIAVRTVEDWAGLRIRATGATTSAMVEAFGAGPVGMSGGEVYGALQKGTVDGVVGGFPSLVSRKWYEQLKYFPEYMMNYSWFPQVANLDSWNNLPPDIQEIMLEAAEEVAKDQNALAVQQVNETRQTCLAEGLEMISLSDEELARWREVCRPIWDDWAAKSPATKAVIDLGLKVSGQ